MKFITKPPVAVFSVFISLALLDNFLPFNKTIEAPVAVKKAAPKIQVAILLDVSNSMDGLIAQAKAQLWNMVSVMGKAKCDGVAPQIEIALYEYGKDNNDPKLGYIKQISPFSGDLDGLSQKLFALTTYGGSEYCGYVIHTSLNDLNWDTASSNYKVIFIAGNEDFLQGNISYTQACTEARQKGVIVNTIYCGNRQQGINEHWNLGAECGNGSFTNINSDAKLEEIPTPYDTTLYVLNTKLNGTYIYYGTDGEGSYEKQEKADKDNAAFNSTASARRIAVKGNSQLYRNSSWDLVDAIKTDSVFLAKVDMKTLPDSLKNKSRKELKIIVTAKSNERGLIQKQIAAISSQREKFIAAERAKATSKNNQATLETEVEKIIRLQAKRYNMVIE